MSDVVAYVTEENGQIILHDPAAAGVLAAVSAHNREIGEKCCQIIFDKNADSIERFKRIFTEKNYSTREKCLVFIQVDDYYGSVITEKLMPGYDWSPIRNAGQEPIARGIADRDFIQTALGFFADDAARRLQECPDDLVAVVVGGRTASIFPV